MVAPRVSLLNHEIMNKRPAVVSKRAEAEAQIIFALLPRTAIVATARKKPVSKRIVR